MSSKRLRTWSSIAFVALMVVIGAWYVHGHLDAFKKIFEIDLQSFAALSALCIVSIWISGLHVTVLVKIFGVDLRGWEAFGLSAVNTMANFYFTKAGMATKGVYLKRKHDFSYTHFLSTLAGAYVVSLVTYGVMGTTLYLWSVRHGGLKLQALVVFGALIAGGLLPLALPRLHRSIGRFVPGRVQRVMEGWEEVRRHHWNLVVLAFLNAAYIVVGGFRLYVAYHAAGYAVKVLPCVIISTLQTITVIFTLTPGAVGIRQALVGYGSGLLNIGATEGVVASTIDHAVGTLWVFVVGIIFTNWIWVSHVKSGAGGKEAKR